MTDGKKTHSGPGATHTRREILVRSSQLVAAAALPFGADSIIRPSGAYAQQQAPLVAFVHTQAAGDNGPIDDMLGALKRLEQDMKIRSRPVYASDPATYETIFRNLGNAGASVVITTFFAVAQPLKAVAPSFPNTKFVHLYADPVNPPMANLQTVGYKQYLADYLAGIYGARVSRTGAIGYIGGASTPTLNGDFNALKAGALSVRPDIKVTPAFVGSFQDPGKAREIASQMYQSGIDFIQCGAAGSNPGIIQAANDGKDRMVSGTSLANMALGPKTLHTTIAVAYGKSLYAQAKAALDGKFTGGNHMAGMEGGVVDFVLSERFLMEGDPAAVSKAKEIFVEVEKAKQAIADGKLVVPLKTDI